MPKVNAEEKKKAMKAAEKKLAEKGITAPKSRHAVLTGGVPRSFPVNDYEAAKQRAISKQEQVHEPQGVDTGTLDIVESDQPGQKDSAINHITRSLAMNQVTPGNDGVAKAAQMKADAEAVKKAKADKAAAEKATKAAEKAEAQAKAKAEKEEKAKAVAEQKAVAKAAQDADRLAKKAERDAAAAESRANRAPRERTYTGSMLSLSDRVATGVYVKGVNGQLRSNDDVAVALESIPAPKMVAFLLSVLGLAANPYASLNYGQQSMNLRNKLRGAIKAKPVEGVAAITVETVKAARDAGDWTQPIPKAEKLVPVAKEAAAA